MKVAGDLETDRPVKFRPPRGPTGGDMATVDEFLSFRGLKTAELEKFRSTKVVELLEMRLVAKFQGQRRPGGGDTAVKAFYKTRF